MAHLGWFFAGTSLGLFVGVLLTSMAQVTDLLRGQDTPELQVKRKPARPMIVRR